MDIVFLFPLFLSNLLAVIAFFNFLFTEKKIPGNFFLPIDLVTVFGGPLFYLLVADVRHINDCCNESALFSPEHRLSIYVLIGLCIAAYFYSGYRKTLAAPVVEMITNALLIAGIVLNVLMFIHEEIFVTIVGNTPIILLFVMRLDKNQRMLIAHIHQMEIKPGNRIERIALKILLLKPVVKYPVLFVICLPLLLIITAVLFFVGQKPDSMIRAFTDTYKHGFSQLDYMCENVECGEHFLCSVAAKGHKQIVKPTRLGIRNERLILCNRQLLISNAFEDLLQQKLPFLHKRVRRSYNRVGDVIHRYYYIFNKKWVCDLVYIIMKPAEWIFLLTLYTFDRNPENRIAKQYISRSHRQQLDKQLS